MRRLLARICTSIPPPAIPYTRRGSRRTAERYHWLRCGLQCPNLHKPGRRLRLGSSPARGSRCGNRLVRPNIRGCWILSTPHLSDENRLVLCGDTAGKRRKSTLNSHLVAPSGMPAAARFRCRFTTGSCGGPAEKTFDAPRRRYRREHVLLYIFPPAGRAKNLIHFSPTDWQEVHRGGLGGRRENAEMEDSCTASSAPDRND